MMHDEPSLDDKRLLLQIALDKVKFHRGQMEGFEFAAVQLQNDIDQMKANLRVIKDEPD